MKNLSSQDWSKATTDQKVQHVTSILQEADMPLKKNQEKPYQEQVRKHFEGNPKLQRNEALAYAFEQATPNYIEEKQTV